MFCAAVKVDLKLEVMILNIQKLIVYVIKLEHNVTFIFTVTKIQM